MAENTGDHIITTEEEAQARLWTLNEPGVPLFVSVALTIRPERLDAFTAALAEVLPKARAEDTCLYLNVGRSVADRTVFVLSEGWSDVVQYRDVILQKDYFQEYLRISEEAYASPRITTLLEPFPSTL